MPTRSRVRLLERHGDSEQYATEQNRDRPVGRGIGEPTGEPVIGQLPASEWTDDVRQAGAQVDVSEQPVAIGTVRRVGNGALRDHDVRFGQSGEEAGHHQQRKAPDRERRRDEHVEHGRRAQRTEENGATADAVGQRPDHRRTKELTERVQGQQEPQHQAALRQARGGRQHPVVVVQDHGGERGDHEAVAEKADEDHDIQRHETPNAPCTHCRDPTRLRVLATGRRSAMDDGPVTPDDRSGD